MNPGSENSILGAEERHEDDALQDFYKSLKGDDSSKEKDKNSYAQYLDQSESDTYTSDFEELERLASEQQQNLNQQLKRQAVVDNISSSRKSLRFDDTEASEDKDDKVKDEHSILKDKKVKRDVLKRPGNPINTAIYVTGLPRHTDKDSIAKFFSRAGVIMDDMFTGQPRIKLYIDENETADDRSDQGKDNASSLSPTISALIVYLRPESVTLAIDLLDGVEYSPSHILHIEPAHSKPENMTKTSDVTRSNTSSAPIDKRQWIKQMQAMKSKLDWFDPALPRAALCTEISEQELLWKRIVLIKNMLADDVDEEELLRDVEDECSRLGLGIVRVRVMQVKQLNAIAADSPLFISVKCKDVQSASKCASIMNGRMYDGRRLEAHIYDGTFDLIDIRKEVKRQKRLSRYNTDSLISDNNDLLSDEEHTRLDTFGEWLERQESDENKTFNSDFDSDEGTLW